MNPAEFEVLAGRLIAIKGLLDRAAILLGEIQNQINGVLKKENHDGNEGNSNNIPTVPASN